MKTAATHALLLAATSGALGGCFLWTSTDQGAALERRATALEARLTEVESGQAANTEHLHTKMTELETVLAQATQVVTRNSADTGALVETLQGQVSTQEGLLAELRQELTQVQREMREQQADYENRMKRLSRRAGIDMPVEDSEIPAAADDHYRAAQSAYEQREFSVARALYRAFVTRHPTDARADDAQYLVGQSYLLEDRPATALGELRRVIAEHAQGDAVPLALFAMGDAFWRLHACTEARSSLDALVRGYPRAPSVAEARTRLRDMQRPPAGYCQEAAAAPATPAR